ncbi:MAG: hypothetical protein FVQ85_14965 [Planctomycetes bacterium]|nr:hypothetical protein [Planctomycetota bacterium]
MKTEKMTRNALVVALILEICVSVSSGWSTPVPVSEVNTQYQEGTPFLSFDGLTLYFARTDTSTFYYARIFEATRSVPYGPFTSVSEVLISSNKHVRSPWVTPDNLRMYYAAQTETPILYQLKVSERASVNDPWPQGIDILELNMLGRLGALSLTADELIIFFDSPDIPGGLGGYDMWMATRPDMNSPFGQVTNLAELNTVTIDGGPYVTPDGLTLLFYSNRNGSYQLFRATRQSLSEPFGNIEHLSAFDTPDGLSVSPGLSSDGSALYFIRQPSVDRSTRDIYVSYVDPGPIAHWKFDEGSGAIAYDSAGNNDGTIYGAAWTTGQLGGALDFDGVDDYVEVSDDPSLRFTQYDSFSVSFWAKPSTGGYVFSKLQAYSQSGQFGYALRWLSTTSKFQFMTSKSGIVNVFVDTTDNSATAGSWYHVTAVYDKKDMKVYLNAELKGTNFFGYDTSSTSPDNNLTIGVRLYDSTLEQYSDGIIDEVMIFDNALSAGEIEQLYASTGDNLLVNSSFETTELISGGWPSTFGDWSGDHCYILPRYGDVWPYQGSQMLQFAGTSAFGSGADTESQVYQIVDVSAFQGTIAAGKATASASAYFNRLPGDAETDTEFYVDIRAFAGDPCSFPTLQDTGGMHIAEAKAFIYTDGDPATWELCEAQLVLPANTDYVVVGISARENIYNDLAWPEFDGHCADAASLTITVEPNVPEPPGVYYVDGVNGSDLNDGLSPETAFATIQMGIDTATDGNTVFVYPAIYNEALLIDNKVITLKGVPTSAGIPILQKAGDYAVSFYVVQGPANLLANFVIRGSDLGIFIVGGSPMILNVTVVDNVFGIAAYAGATPDISNCIFWNNTDGDLFGDPNPIQARYSYIQDVNGPNVPPPGLISHWKFDEGAGSIAYDSAGTDDGTIFGTTWTTGQIGGALDFDGVDDYVDMADTVKNYLGTNYTVSAWIKTNSFFPDNYIAAYRHSTDINPVLFVLHHYNENIGFAVRDNSLNIAEALYTDTLTTNTWYHVAGVRAGNILNVYVNGVGGIADSATFGAITSDNLKIGATRFGGNPISEHFDGTIDEVAIYNRALSAEEIKQIYQPVGGPMFADTAGGDYHLLSERGRHWPAHDVWVLDEVTSPCVDGGDPAINPSNETMPNGGGINMGAYGNTAYASMSEWPIAEDNNRDGVVNMIDIAKVVAKWLEKLDWVE